MTATDLGPRPGAPPPPAGKRAGRALPTRRSQPSLPRGVVVVIAVGAVLRFWTGSDLWLDEALTVNIAGLPLGELFEALRRDGSPPLYYVLLHGWMELFGRGDLAVRSLSGLAAVAALPIAWALGRDIGGPRVAVAMVALLATSPFAIHYATEARMYSLVVLLTAAGALLLRRSLLQPRGRDLAGLGVVSGLLLITHYWAFYLIAAVLTWLAVRAWRTHDRRPVFAAMAATAAGGLLFLPWLPSFLFQLGNTGTPWGGPATFTAIIATLNEFGGGGGMHGWLLSLVFLGLIGLGLFGRPLDGRRVELDLLTRPRARPAAFVTLATLVLAISVNWAVGSAFAPRYTAVVLIPFLVLVALGVGVLDDVRVRTGVLTLACLVGLFGASYNVVLNRTQAAEVAGALRRHAAPGDVVAYCPDQLGPAVSRLAPAYLDQRTFPDGDGPALVDWVDYRARNRAGDPATFAAELIAGAGRANDVWLVWFPGYRTLGNRCETLNAHLDRLRPEGLSRVVASKPGRYFEPAQLWRFRGPDTWQ
ncbi:MAG TPA: glycosyltransferase family 39 protein [Acidimicrobiales bacterium]|nr:glycosyltransferase family 39 protein [Acidimicrobiales bacterium]